MIKFIFSGSESGGIEMKQLINTLILFAVFCLFGAPSCSDEGSGNSRIDKYLTEQRDTVINQFQRTPETEIDLAGYSRAAIQKVYDFADYLNIVADCTLEKEFRIQAAAMIRKLFEDGKTEIEIAASEENPARFTVDSLLRSVRLDKLDVRQVSFSEVGIQRPFMEAAQGIYVAQILLRQDSWFQNHSQHSCLAEADIILKREIKSFGKESFSVWTVKLGEIRCNPGIIKSQLNIN